MSCHQVGRYLHTVIKLCFISSLILLCKLYWRYSVSVIFLETFHRYSRMITAAAMLCGRFYWWRWLEAVGVDCTVLTEFIIIYQQWYKRSRRRFRKHWSLFQLKQWQIFMQNNNITMMFTNHAGIISIRVVYGRIIGRYILYNTK